MCRCFQSRCCQSGRSESSESAAYAIQVPEPKHKLSGVELRPKTYIRSYVSVSRRSSLASAVWFGSFITRCGPITAFLTTPSPSSSLSEQCGTTSTGHLVLVPLWSTAGKEHSVFQGTYGYAVNVKNDIHTGAKDLKMR